MIEQEIIDFFNAVGKLKAKKIIRSDKYLGDIGEYICSKLYGIELNDSGREKGFDGTLNNKKYEIKFHNSKKRTNIYLGTPQIYQVLLVVLGPESMLRPTHEKDTFLIYKLTNTYVMNNFKNESGFSCAKEYFHSINPDKTFNLI
jgi:hypothetical protein